MSCPVIGISILLYSRIICWYPPLLSAEYGVDMRELFAENIEAAWRRAAWPGVLRAWYAVVRDLIGIVLPYRVERAAPLVFAVVGSLVVCGSLLATLDPNHHCHQ